MILAEFKPATSASEQPQAHALDRAATGIDFGNHTKEKYIGGSVKRKVLFTLKQEQYMQ
jgi:hypothetical protein